jgi:hypothetical protein
MITGRGSMANSAPAAAAAATATAGPAVTVAATDTKATSDKPLLVKFALIGPAGAGFFCEGCQTNGACEHVKEWTVGKTFICETSTCPTCGASWIGTLHLVVESEEVMMHTGTINVLQLLSQDMLACRGVPGKKQRTCGATTREIPHDAEVRYIKVMTLIGSAKTSVARVIATKSVPSGAGKTGDSPSVLLPFV